MNKAKQAIDQLWVDARMDYNIGFFNGVGVKLKDLISGITINQIYLVGSSNYKAQQILLRALYIFNQLNGIDSRPNTVENFDGLPEVRKELVKRLSDD